MAARAPYEAETIDPASRSIAWLTVIVLTAIVAVATIVMTFSTANTPMSTDGDDATRSQWIESDE